MATGRLRVASTIPRAHLRVGCCWRRRIITSKISNQINYALSSILLGWAIHGHNLELFLFGPSKRLFPAPKTIASYLTARFVVSGRRRTCTVHALVHIYRVSGSTVSHLRHSGSDCAASDASRPRLTAARCLENSPKATGPRLVGAWRAYRSQMWACLTIPRGSTIHSR